MPSDMKAVNRAIVEEFRANDGTVRDERLRRGKLVLLTTVGAKSGREHTVPLGDFSDDDSRVVLWASAIGAPKHPAWYTNLVADPAVVIERKGTDGHLERIESTATTARGAERERYFELLSRDYPHVAAHQERTAREIPIVVVDC